MLKTNESRNIVTVIIVSYSNRKSQIYRLLVLLTCFLFIYSQMKLEMKNASLQPNLYTITSLPEDRKGMLKGGWNIDRGTACGKINAL